MASNLCTCRFTNDPDCLYHGKGFRYRKHPPLGIDKVTIEERTMEDWPEEEDETGTD